MHEISAMFAKDGVPLTCGWIIGSASFLIQSNIFKDPLSTLFEACGGGLFCCVAAGMIDDALPNKKCRFLFPVITTLHLGFLFYQFGVFFSCAMWKRLAIHTIRKGCNRGFITVDKEKAKNIIEKLIQLPKNYVNLFRQDWEREPSTFGRCLTVYVYGILPVGLLSIPFAFKEAKKMSPTDCVPCLLVKTGIMSAAVGASWPGVPIMMCQ